MKNSRNQSKKVTILLLHTLLLATLFSCTKKDVEDTSFQTGRSTLAATSVNTSVSNNLLYEENFEGSDPFSTYVYRQYGLTPYSFTAGTDRAFEGAKSGRFELHDTDPLQSGGTRSEVLFPEQSSLERWYSFSVYFPSADYPLDSYLEIISQWHAGASSSPPISLNIRSDRFLMDIRPVEGTSEKTDIGAVPKDRWNTFVFHIKHSHDADGLTEIWLNGQKVMNRAGANMYDLSSGAYTRPRWKVGIYKWKWNGDLTTDCSKRVLYFDNIRLGNENATYAEMTSSTLTDTITPTPTPTPTPTDTITPTHTDMQVGSYTLVNAATEKDIMTISDGATISLSALGVSKLNIRANASSSTASVNFNLSGTQSRTYIDNAFPFALQGDDGNGNYYYGNWYPPALGTYTLKATPYSGVKAGGTAGPTNTISFTFTK